MGEVGFTDAALSWAAADGRRGVLAGVPCCRQLRMDGDYRSDCSCVRTGRSRSGASYEWRVQAVLGEGDDALASAWAYGRSPSPRRR